MNKKRLFWIVDSENSEREIFENREEAESFMEEYAKDTGEAVKLIISECKNYFKEENGEWNYADYRDTFNDILTITYISKNHYKQI